MGDATADDAAPAAELTPFDAADPNSAHHTQARGRLEEEMRKARQDQQCPPEPQVSVTDGVATWEDDVDDKGQRRATVLKAAQYDAYQRLQHAGTKQLLTFLSGEGGM